MCQSQNFENRLIFGDYIDKSKVPHFYWPTMYKGDVKLVPIKDRRLKGVCIVLHLRATKPQLHHLPCGITNAICHPTQANVSHQACSPCIQFIYSGGMEGWVDLDGLL